MDGEKMLKGDTAAARAVLSTQPDVVSAYPITPQTGIVETLSEMAADGRILGEFLKVDSEFNAASSCIGASAAGARVFSATCSQGLKLMSEPLFTASGMRLPLVMAVANRSLSAPISIWNDHTDAFAERDGGLIQFSPLTFRRPSTTCLSHIELPKTPTFLSRCSRTWTGSS